MSRACFRCANIWALLECKLQDGMQIVNGLILEGVSEMVARCVSRNRLHTQAGALQNPSRNSRADGNKMLPWPLTALLILLLLGELQSLFSYTSYKPLVLA
eukprot:719971-Pelagomonas_calceolata.AAC.1